MVDQGDKGGPGTRQTFPLPGANSAPVVMWALLAANIVIWWFVSRAGGDANTDVLLDFGAMFGPLIAEGQYWRLLTAVFLHVGPLHLALNGLVLFVFGRIVERAYGHLRFLIIYILAGLAGSVASYLLNSIAVGAGASGAIFGVMGALAAYLLIQRQLFGKAAQVMLTGVLVLAVVELLLGLGTPGIDNWAHTGGLAAGLALGLVLSPKYRRPESPTESGESLVDTNPLSRSMWVVPVAGLVLVLGTWLGTRTLPDNPFSHVYSAQRYFEAEDYAQALDEVDRAVDVDLTAGEAYLLRGRLLLETGDIEGARHELGKAITWGDRETRADAIRLLISVRTQR